jgi:Leucine-rich repeat (LRR) protein
LKNENVVNESNQAEHQTPMASHYYVEETQTLALPPPKRISAADTGSNPAPVLPLYAIITQPYAHSLRCLILANRRLDKSFALPHDVEIENLLPSLEELNLHNCKLMDRAMVSMCMLNQDPEMAPRSNQDLLPLIIKMFPNLQILDLSENALRSSFTEDILCQLVFAMDGRRGLKHLRLRGNRLQDLNGFKAIASSFNVSKSTAVNWTLEELDVGYNNIEELPCELGVLPLNILSVEGNV